MFSLTQARYRAMRAGIATGILLAIGSLGAGVTAPDARATAPPAAASQARAATLATGSGSSYVAVAMDDWTRSAGVRGIRVQYNGNLGSPAGVGQYTQNQVDFAGTEAEVRSLQSGDINLARGYQYVPDVAGAIAVMYNIRDRGGNKVDWLHLDQRTISKIFTGQIKNWSHPEITRTNDGKALPNQPIKVVYRTGLSGTTSLFYDFVREAARDVYDPWRSRHGVPDRRILELPPTATNEFATPVGRTTSDAMADFIASSNGLWSIGYDEFAFAKKFGVPAAWVRNGAGQWVQPFAENIAEALKDARLRPDLSQELSGVYTSRRRIAYPISAYSYMMVQCRPSPDRSTCRGSYGDGGKADTLAQFMRYVACDGQVKMARIGYSPLPPNLSQEMEKSVARMTGGTPRTLNAGNCSNPTFHGGLGDGARSPADPFTRLVGGVAGATSGGGRSGASAGPSAGASAGTNASGLGTVDGGSGRQQETKPVSFNGPSVPGLGVLPTLVLLAALVMPPAVMVIRRWLRQRAE